LTVTRKHAFYVFPHFSHETVTGNSQPLTTLD
jgi:hypothetical protein